MPEQNETERLINIIKRRDREINDIKNSLADIKQNIRDINESDKYVDPNVKKREISELCTNTIYELLVDEKNRTTTTYHSNK